MSFFTGLIKKQLFKQIKIFHWIFSFSNMLRKTNFLSISVLLFLDSNFFLLKSELLCEFPKKYFKTTEKHSLAICGSFWGEKLVFINISPIFTGLVKNSCLNKSKTSSGFTRFKYIKKNKLSDYFMLLSEIVNFDYNSGSLWISKKILENNREA